MTRDPRFCWVVCAPFFEQENTGWLGNFVQRTSVRFVHVQARYHHVRWRRRTSLLQWFDYLVHGLCTFVSARRAGPNSGFITVFPQLALVLGMLKLLSGSQRPLVAWCFNLGHIPDGLLRRIVQACLSRVDVFVVHAEGEIDTVSQGLGLKRDRFLFVPLQRPLTPITLDEDLAEPFALALGTAQRDYPTLLQALAGTDIPCVIVATREALGQTSLPGHVRLLSELSAQACHDLIQRSRLVVTPIQDALTAAGQVTLLDAMVFGKASIATRSIGTVDYVVDGQTACLVPPGDVSALRSALLRLWSDAPYRSAMGVQARAYVAANLSDEAIAARMDAILQAQEGRTASR